MRRDKNLFLFAISLILFVFAISFSSADYMYCSDSDSGINYFVYGNVGTSYLSVPMESQITRTYDTCYQYSSPTSVCTGETCYIRESYCGGPYLNDLNYSIVSCYSLGYSSCADGECYETYPAPATANCFDGIKNRDEADIDCGGVYCSTCATGRSCSTSADCSSTICLYGVCYESPQESISLDVDLGGNDPGDHSWVDSSGYNVMMQLRVVAQGDVLLDKIEFSTSGTGNEINIVSLTVYEDNDANGQYDGDSYIASSSLLSDNTNLIIDLNDFYVDEDPVNLIVVYRMNVGTQLGTYSLKFKELKGIEEGNSSNIVRAYGNFENTKTVINNNYNSGHCANGIMEFNLGETGVDCGGACSTCPPQYNPGETPDCLPPEMSCPSDIYPLCNPMTEYVYACIGGVLTPLFADYNSICGGECTDEDFICNYYDYSYSVCERGVWSPPYYTAEDFYSYCGGGEYECDPMYESTECYDGIPYSCNDFGAYVIDEELYQNGYCGDYFMCNPGEAYCNYDWLSVSICTEGGWWEIYDSQGNVITVNLVVNNPAEDSFFNFYCGGSDFIDPDFNPSACENIGEKRCNPIMRLMEVCDGSWTIIPHSEEEYNQTCEDIECNWGWFKCNPAEEEVSFCINNMWGSGTSAHYDDYCMPDDVTLGRAPKTLVGEVINNTIIIHKFLPSEPVLIEKTRFTLGKPIYWILGAAGLIVLIILISLIVYFATKYSTMKKISFGSKKVVKK